MTQSESSMQAAGRLLPGERVILDLMPAKASIVVMAAPWLGACAVIAGAGIGATTSEQISKWGVLAVELAILIALAALVIAALRRRFTRFTLSDRRIAAATGILARVTMEVGPSGVRHVAMRSSILERLLGLGTIAVATAGSDAYEVVWWHIADPEIALAQLREGLAAWNPVMPVRFEPAAGIARPPSRLQRESPQGMMAPVPTPAGPTPSPSSIPVIGLAGGIGAGKTFVAKLFERLGCYVVDSDARAKAALDRPDVRDELVRWWGERILAEDGRVDRAEIARIVFADPEERRRLESLVHPLVRQDRARLIAEASGFWPKAIIVDAPLLFEAGIDKECDAVVFVDAPLEERLRRVLETRAWDEAELAKREASQGPLDQKRARSQYVVENTGSEADILRRAEEVLGGILASKAAAEQSPDSPDNKPV